MIKCRASTDQLASVLARKASVMLASRKAPIYKKYFAISIQILWYSVQVNGTFTIIRKSAELLTASGLFSLNEELITMY